MADAVTSRVLFESASDLVMKFTNISDGTGEAAVLKVDVSALSPACAEVDILKVLYATSGMSVRILFDGTADVLGVLVPADQGGCIDFTKMQPGGLRNNAAAGKTGDLLFTTNAHTSGDTYDITLVMKKRQTAEI